MRERQICKKCHRSTRDVELYTRPLPLFHPVVLCRPCRTKVEHPGGAAWRPGGWLSKTPTIASPMDVMLAKMSPKDRLAAVRKNGRKLHR